MKCSKCDKYATGRLSPDLDIKGVGFCDEHEAEVKMEMLVLIFEGEEAYEKMKKK